MGSKQDKLIKDLFEAAELLRREGDTLFSSFDSSEQFAKKLDEIRLSLEERSINPIKLIRSFYLRKLAKIWFAPTSDWDDSIGINGLKLGNDLFENL